MCRIRRWSTLTLQHKIGELLIERTAVCQNLDELIELIAERRFDWPKFFTAYLDRHRASPETLRLRKARQ